MSTVARRMSSGAVALLAQGADGVPTEAAQVRGLSYGFGWRGLDEPGPQRESWSEREFGLRPVDDEWGRSESLDPDNVGDIADEGAGHRG
jgi:hypothetical protein